MTTTRAVVSTESDTAPLLLALYDHRGLVGRIELSPQAALGLALDLLQIVVAKMPADAPATNIDHHTRRAGWPERHHLRGKPR